MTLQAPYLPSVDWYRAYVSAYLGHTPCPQVGEGALPHSSLIRGKWGEQRLTVPLEGGKRRAAALPYGRQRASEHGSWRHTHWQALTSAYGRLPFFHLCAPVFEPLYTCGPVGNLASWTLAMHRLFVQECRLHDCLDWLLDRDGDIPGRCMRRTAVPGHISAMELLFSMGPETVYALLP